MAVPFLPSLLPRRVAMSAAPSSVVDVHRQRNDRRSNSQGEARFVYASLWYVEFFIGVCMLFIVTWLVVYRMVEIKHCWKLHVGIRYYFGLTILATIVNLSLGICGSIFLTNGE